MNKKKYFIVTILLFVITLVIISFPKKYGLERNITNCKSPHLSVAYEKFEAGICMGITKDAANESKLDNLDCFIKTTGTECIGIKVSKKAQVAL